MGKQRIIPLVLIAVLTTGLFWSVDLAKSQANAADGEPRMSVRAYPLKAVTARQDLQTIFIIVQDQNLVPVQGAEVSIGVLLPDGAEQLYIVIQPTDYHGMTKMSFPVSGDEVGLVYVKVHAARSRMEAISATSFRIWW
jgi:hypothetical protein